MPARTDPQSAVSGLAARLLTLRVTVVMSRDLDTPMTHDDDDAMQAAMYEQWTRYLDSLDQGDTGAERVAPPKGTPSHEDFAALARRAQAIYARLEQAPSDPTAMAIVRRIMSSCKQLSAPPGEGFDRIAQHLMLAKAKALGTDPVLLETEIRIDGDVTTRINQSLLEQGDGPREQLVLELQRMGVQTAIAWWSDLVGLISSAGRSLLELVLKR